MTDRFHIGYYLPQIAPNLRSTSEHPHVVDEALSKKLAENRIAGPYPVPPYPNLRIFFGVVPKKDGSWRLIYNLSAPIGNSINDFIDPVHYSLQYATIDDATNICHHLGKNALLAKVDIKNAFRLCSINRHDLPPPRYSLEG